MRVFPRICQPNIQALGILICFFSLSGLADQVKETFELKGKIVRFDDGKPIRRDSVPIVFLRSVNSPMTLNTLVGPSGKFSFDDIPPGPYRITIAVPSWGQMEKSIDIGPSFSDHKNRIEMEFKFKPDYQTGEQEVVSIKQLTIPDEARDQYRKALESLEEPNTEEAIEYLQKSVKIAPNYSDAWNRLGTIAFVSGDYPQAETYFRTAHRHDPGSFSPVVNLGAALYAQEKMEESLVYNRKAVEMNPQDPLANSQLGLSLLALRDYAQAEDHLLKCKSLDPAHFSHPQVSLAELYRQTGNIEGMVRELEEFIYYHPDDKKVPDLKRILAEIETSSLSATEPER